VTRTCWVRWGISERHATPTTGVLAPDLVCRGGRPGPATKVHPAPRVETSHRQNAAARHKNRTIATTVPVLLRHAKFQI
jgi:hypothetical protein